MSPPVRLQTHVWNPMGDRRALLVHGLTSDGTSWWRLASDLADDGWMVVAPDLRGHGRSPAGADHAIATLAEDVALLGDGYDLAVGHSLGGSIVATLLARPGFASAAVLVDPVLHLDVDAHARLRTDLHAGLSADPDAIRGAHPRWHERDVQRKALALRLVTPDVVDGVLDDNDPWDVRSATPAWQARVHLLAADPDLGALLSAEQASAAAARSTVSWELIEGAGHSIQRDDPSAVARAVRTVTEGT